MKRAVAFLITLSLIFSCKPSVSGHFPAAAQAGETKNVPKEKISFSADSAFSYIQAQTDFGPRIPGTKAHSECALFLKESLERYGLKVTFQDFTATTFDGTRHKCRNIIAKLNPEKTSRVIVASHWDTRPWADSDPNPENRNKTLLGANDGASGVGVILELARQFQSLPPAAVGVDFVLFDLEDWGPGPDYQGDETFLWGLGSQYYSQRAKAQNYYARWGVLLDMVGGEKATFFKELYSMHYAKSVVEKVWGAASVMGHSRQFIQSEGFAATDDHLFVNLYAGIPMIDIIPYMPESDHSAFGATWHTVQDTPENLSKETLKAVGETLLYTIYNEK